MTAPYTPTTKQVADNIQSQITASMGITSVLLPKAFIRVLSSALAAVVVVLYKYAGFILLQQFVRTASDQPTTINGRTVVPLDEWGVLVGVPARTPATQAELTIDVTVTSQTGFLRTGDQLIGPDNGVTYLIAGDVALDASVVQAVARASGDQQGGNGSGTIGNLEIGQILTFANPLPNVARETTVVGAVTTGTDEETTASYRTRILDRFQKRPQGGAYADYEQWAEEAPGTLNAYPYTSTNPGQVDVYIESSTEVDGIPTVAQLQEALALINLDQNGLATRRPANALATTFPITRTAFDVEVQGLSVPGDLATVQDQIDAALTAYFLERAPFIVGLSVGLRTDQVTETAVGGRVDDVVSAAGGVFAGVEMSVAAVPTDIYELGIGEKAKLGALTYV